MFIFVEAFLLLYGQRIYINARPLNQLRNFIISDERKQLCNVRKCKHQFGSKASSILQFLMVRRAVNKIKKKKI